MNAIELKKRDHAQAAARRGIRVFPVIGKRQPAIKGYPKLATTDPEQIDRWWDQWPDANIGGAVGPLGDGRYMLCVDADNKPGQCGSITVLEHDMAGRELSPTYEQDTPNGRHWIYVTDTPVKLRGA